MYFTFRRIRLAVYLLIALLGGMLTLVTGCGGQDPNAPKGPPIPDSPRAHQGPGTPIKLFGAGANRFRPGANDPEYQEYLLWKEWKEYQRYQEFLKSQGRPSILDEDGQNTQQPGTESATE